jgi:hypothetical protein
MFLKDILDISPKNYVWITNEKYQELYQRFVPLCESSERTYFKVEAEINF